MWLLMLLLLLLRLLTKVSRSRTTSRTTRTSSHGVHGPVSKRVTATATTTARAAPLGHHLSALFIAHNCGLVSLLVLACLFVCLKLDFVVVLLVVVIILK